MDSRAKGRPAQEDNPNFVDPPPLFNSFYRQDEAQVVAFLLNQIPEDPEQSKRISTLARRLVEGVRAGKRETFSVSSLLQTYGLDSQEGLALMCLAEALLRIPDKETKTKLIQDKIGSIDWEKRRGQKGEKKENFLTKVANLGLVTADQVMRWGLEGSGFFNTLGDLTRRIGEPVIRQGIAQAMKLLGHQFVMGENIHDALKRAAVNEQGSYRHSYDMLGEAAYTQEDAHRYYQAYDQAIAAIGKAKKNGTIFTQPSISVKLSALHPRYELTQKTRVHQELLPLVIHLAQMAKDHGIGFTIDAEESERLDLSLDIIEAASGHESLTGWNGFGLAVQAYQKRSPLVIDFLIDMARHHQRRLCLRLVKGAYWDSEIKRTQQQGLTGYPVFTRKVFTDTCYHVCAQKLLEAPDAIYPQFATHNAHTVATILELAGNRKDFEFQRLQGMGETLYGHVVKETSIPCRIYAPVGNHRDLLAYLVRRLLENGANTSFVHKIHDASISIDALIADPIAEARSVNPIPHPKIPLPLDMLRPQRQNSHGIDLHNREDLKALFQKMEPLWQTAPGSSPWHGCPLVSGKETRLGEPASLFNPANTSQAIGQAWNADETLAEEAMAHAYKAFSSWSLTPVERRAQALEYWGDLLETHREELMALLVYEAGKTIRDALSEVREAVDFCRYYAAEACRLMGRPLILPGPTGEKNELTLHGRGLFVCISPWNFPLAIFTGQVAAALATGNCVVAKPAHQTPLVGHRAVQLAHLAGIPKNVLHYLPGKGSVLGAALVRDPRTAGVAFTGSTTVAQGIARTLLSRENAPIVPLIAETGGMNAMIVDSSALPEQVIQDIITSAFQSAGQRCSALRLVFLQEEIAGSLIKMLKGAMAELSVGDPSLLSTDIGPVIDGESRNHLQRYEDQLSKTAHLIYRVDLGKNQEGGHFLAPQAWELSAPSQMTEEVFGPILHVVRFKGEDLDKVVDHINATGYGLTLGVHSRIEKTIQRIRQRVRVGNLYVNRNMIGAVVGIQPFGGEGLSGTGPKAGGPHYLTRFTVERAFSQDTTASGGNASLLADMD